MTLAGAANVFQISDSTDWSENQLINSGFSINRRLPAALTTIPAPSATGRVFTADRWGVINQGGTPQYGRIEAPIPGLSAKYYGQYKQTVAPARWFWSQSIKSEGSYPLRNRLIRVMASLRSDVVGGITARLGLVQLAAGGADNTIPAVFISAWNADGTDPSLGANLAYINPNLQAIEGTGSASAGHALSCPLTLIFQKFSAVFQIPSYARNLIFAIWLDNPLPVGNVIEMSECGVYPSAAPKIWMSAPREIEIARSFRYFPSTFPDGIPPAQSAGTNGCLRFPVTKAGVSANSIVGEWRFPIEVRRTPLVSNITFYNPLANDTHVHNSSAGTDSTAESAVDLSAVSIGYQCTGRAGWTAGDKTNVHITIELEI